MIGKLPIIIDELLRYRESPRKMTKKFKNLKHNEYLCPAVEKQMNRILDCFIKYHSIAYDVQGVNDKGTDIFIRYYVKMENGETKSKFISFQIKSYDDLKEKTYLKDLKAQCFEAKGEYGDSLEQYYVLLCTEKNEHLNKIREIKKAFSYYKDVTIIDPVCMATFLRLNPIRISSIVSTILRDDDIIYEKASSDLILLTPTEIAVYAAIVIEMTTSIKCSFEIDKLKENDYLRKVYLRIPDYIRDTYFYLEEVNLQSDDKDEDDIDDEVKECKDRKREFEARFSEDIDTLSEGLFNFDETGDIIKVNQEFARPMQAVILDGMVRYNCSKDHLLEFVLTSLGIMERFGIDEMEHEDWID